MSVEWQAEQLPYPMDADYIGESVHILELEAAAGNIVGELNAGNTFIYLFRRFGYPRFGWDGMKQLALYRISTPMAGVGLNGAPYVTGAFTIAYMLRDDISRQYEDEYRKPYQDRYKRFEEWAIEQRGIETIHIYYEPDQDKLNRVWRTWVAANKDTDFESQSDAEHIFYNEQAVITTALSDEYAKIEPRVKRTSLEGIPDSIMKQCHVALCAAIRDLLRPVYVRDVMINVCGFVRWDETQGDDNAVDYAIGSGCGVGDKLGSVSGEEHAATVISNLDRWKFRRCVESIERYGCSSWEEGMSVKCDTCTYDIPTDEWETLQQEKRDKQEASE